MSKIKGPSNRQLKVAEEIKHVLAQSFTRGDFFADISEIVTISEVQVSADLRHATVFVLEFGGTKDKVAFVEKIKLLIPALRKVIAQNVHLKFVPDLVFKYDDSFEKQMRIDEIFHKIKG